MATAGDFDTIEDTGNLNQKMLIRSLNNARERVRSVRNKAHEQINSTSNNHETEVRRRGQRVYLEVVKAYGLELASSVQEHNDELWNETPLMQVDVVHEPQKSDKDVVEISPEKVSKVITGFKTFLLTDFPLTVQFEVTYRDSAKGDDTVIEQERWTPRFAQTDAVLLQIDDARKDLGLHFDSPEERNTRHTDYGNDTSW